MDRPYIICHMSTSLDGKITGPYMETAAALACFEEYERVNQFYQPQAWINGRIPRLSLGMVLMLSSVCLIMPSTETSQFFRS